MNEYQKGSPGRKKGHTCFCSSGRKARTVSCMSLLSEKLLHRCLMKRDTAVFVSQCTVGTWASLHLKEVH